jgi:hypothetical protein
MQFDIIRSVVMLRWWLCLRGPNNYLSARRIWRPVVYKTQNSFIYPGGSHLLVAYVALRDRHLHPLVVHPRCGTSRNKTVSLWLQPSEQTVNSEFVCSFGSSYEACKLPARVAFQVNGTRTGKAGQLRSGHYLIYAQTLVILVNVTHSVFLCASTTFYNTS